MTSTSTESFTRRDTILSVFTPRQFEGELVTHLLRPLFPSRHEVLIMVGFDASDRLIKMIEVFGDTADRCALTPDHWRHLVAGRRLTRALLVHNHLSGLARPSEADLRLTRDAATHLRFFAIDLFDHLILVANGHFSFAKAGLL